MSAYEVGRTVIVYKDRFAYLAHPDITVLSNGEWLAGFGHSRRQEKVVHPPADPLFRTLLIRSTTMGKTWQDPYFAPDFDWSGVDPPGLSQLRDGTVVFTQFRWGWYPLSIARKRRVAGELISISLPGRGWTEDFTDEEWRNSQYPWARGYHGLYAHLSTNEGHTFETVKLVTTPYRAGFSRTGVIELSDGRVLHTLLLSNLRLRTGILTCFSPDQVVEPGTLRSS